MKKIFSICMVCTLVYAESLNSHGDGNHTTIKINSVRSILGENNPIKHTSGQLRVGFIQHNDKATQTQNAYGLGGHFHLDSKQWNGLSVGASAYAVLNIAQNQANLRQNPDFFDANGDGFILISEAYLHAKWAQTELKLGRQILDTPHADSDDIRMMPNYFEAYTLTNTDIAALTLTAGYITKMAGWENGVDSSRFVNLGKTLATESIDGLFYAAGMYEGIEDLSLSLWYYHYVDIANLLYAEVAYTAHPSTYLDITLGLQYDTSWDTGKSLLQAQDAQTFGVSMELVYEAIGMHILMAYNTDRGSTGASSLNLGGGTLFTSMEDQTLDAMEQAGDAWVFGMAYHFSTMGLEGLNAGVAYGSFQSEDASKYKVKELDAIVEYSFNEKFSMGVTYADINSKTMTDYTQVRMFTNYNF